MSIIPTFDNGQAILDVRGFTVVVDRTEKDDDGFFRIFYDLNGGETWCYAVDCEEIDSVKE